MAESKRNSESTDPVFDIRRQLRRTWTPFFSRFGTLLPVQLKAIPVILGGQNAVIVSPTASGKTEAVVAPVAEKMLRDGVDGISTLYISPTRALVNDTEVRCAEPLAEVGIACVVRTGDRPELTPRKAAHFVITTPESVDSLLCRSPDLFRSVRTVILDELHLVDGTYRGDQLRVLLARLRGVAEQGDVSTHALSATLADPAGVASRYMTDFEIIEHEGQREIVYTAVSSLSEAISVARSEDLRKLLVFANSRAKVEETASQLGDYYPKNKIATHHGSLSKAERLETESFMRESRMGICVATMTLEIGIDIGNIDAILLVDPPLSVSSLLQRIGRGNRRSSVVRAIAVYSSDQERLAYDRLVECARRGAIGEDPYVPDLSVVVQQTFSILFGAPQGMKTDRLRTYFSGFCSSNEWDRIVAHLRSQELIGLRGDTLLASTSVMDMGERGRLHSNIADAPSIQVIDESSGQTVGNVADTIDDYFSLAGRTWKVARQRDSKLYVRPSAMPSTAPGFHTHRSVGAFHRYLPDDLKKRSS